MQTSRPQYRHSLAFNTRLSCNQSTTVENSIYQSILNIPKLSDIITEPRLLHLICVLVCGPVWMYKHMHPCGHQKSAPGIIPWDTFYLAF